MPVGLARLLARICPYRMLTHLRPTIALALSPHACPPPAHLGPSARPARSHLPIPHARTLWLCQGMPPAAGPALSPLAHARAPRPGRPGPRARACPSCFSRTYTVPYPHLAPLPDARVTPPLVLQPQQPAAAVPCGRLDYCTSPSKAAAAVISLSPPSPSKKELTGPRRSRWVN